jgi:adenylate kinase
VLTGIPASGGTTVLKKALKEVDYVHLNYGDVMSEIAIAEGFVENRDQMRKMPPEIQKDIQKRAAIKIKEDSKTKNVVVDTHCTISTPRGFLPGLPQWVLEELNPDTFILVEANPDEIMMRRISDETRTRDMESYEDIKLHQEMNRAASMAYATITGATVKILKNHNDQLDIATRQLVETLK